LIHAGIQIRYKSTTCLLSAENILNQSYFDYMDRMRYFAMSPGRNITVQIKKQF
jgi:outer membrane receptor protein involved in Fe transport